MIGSHTGRAQQIMHTAFGFTVEISTKHQRQPSCLCKFLQFFDQYMSLPQFNLWYNNKKKKKKKKGKKKSMHIEHQPIQRAQLPQLFDSNNKQQNNVHRQKLGPKTNAHSRHKFWVDVPNTNIDLRVEINDPLLGRPTNNVPQGKKTKKKLLTVRIS